MGKQCVFFFHVMTCKEIPKPFLLSLSLSPLLGNQFSRELFVRQENWCLDDVGCGWSSSFYPTV